MRTLTTRRAGLSRLLPAAAERDATGIAIRDQGVSISWAAAATRSGQLAEALHRIGVGRGDRVGVHHRKGAEGFLAMHAVVQVGAVAVPLDPTASSGYLSDVAGHAGCRVALTHELCRLSALDLAEAADLDAIVGIERPTDDDNDHRTRTFVSPEELDGLDAREPVDVASDDPAYLITTSGSTGRPKGICHTHASALAYVEFKLAAYDFRPEDRIADIAPNHFDISTQALWVTPSVGATNVVVPEPYQMLPASLSQLAADEAITVWYSVPYLLMQLLQRGNLPERDLSALRWVLFGGEVFPPGALAALMAAVPSARFSNVYGPAEVNACAVHHLPGPPPTNETVPIGAPFAGTRIRLVDPDRGDIEAGGDESEPAEIWVNAPTMMVGYWNESGEAPGAPTIEQIGDERWYRTGDLAWRRADGQLVFAGRVDNQVKVRGRRIELESIEAVLEDVEGVDYAVAAVARSDDGADVLIAGIAAPSGEAAPGHDVLRDQVVNHLPFYALPSMFLPLRSKPTTGSGKLDRRALRLALVEQFLVGEEP